jgi:hypothetical protein
MHDIHFLKVCIVTFPMVVLAMGGCQHSDTSDIQRCPLDDFERIDFAVTLAELDHNARAVSDIEHYYRWTGVDFGDRDALRLTPEEYATLRRRSAIQEAVEILQRRSDELAQQAHEMLNKVRSDPLLPASPK